MAEKAEGKHTPNFVVVSEGRTSYQVAKYYTEAAARAYFDNLDHYLGSEFCLSKMLLKVIVFDDPRKATLSDVKREGKDGE